MKNRTPFGESPFKSLMPIIVLGQSRVIILLCSAYISIASCPNVLTLTAFTDSNWHISVILSSRMWYAGHWWSWSKYLSNGEFVHNIIRIHSILIVNCTLHIRFSSFGMSNWICSVQMIPNTKHKMRNINFGIKLHWCECSCV